MEFLVRDILGKWGIVGVTGFLIFLLAFKYSISIFNWIENQTLGTRTFILDQFEFLFIKVEPLHVTYVLIFLSCGLGAITFLICGLFGKWLMGFMLALVLSFIGFKIPKPIIKGMVERRIKEYSNQMVDAMTLLSNGIRAGLSLPQSLAMVVDEMPAPICQEFGVILQQNKIGVPLEECFENLAVRVPTEDNDMFVASINILRETGGNLAEVFDTIVVVIRERVRLQQKIDTYTAQGMFQGYTIFAMPFAIGGMYFVSDPKSVEGLFTNPIGIAAVIFALMLDLVGLFVIKQVVKIKV
ncbi:MAG: hypothetical protein HN509_10300 [Halobacteriovoraceae bacterium]|jgi:tight adherence protein B|nr:hypothetical protein [Halobacteriovoraceae bacterium]MBT5094559.1 hypothetical protein [Halobacteriovoraceae bacterium]